MACCKHHKSDITKCIPFYIVGFILLLAGLPLMIAGIAGTFRYADLLGYVGGVAVFFAIMFLLLWHMFTIPTLERMTPWEIDAADQEKGATTTSVAEVRNKGKVPAFANLGYQNDSSLPGAHLIPSKSSSVSSSGSSLIDREFANVNNSNNRDDPEANYENMAFDTEPSISTISGTTVMNQYETIK